jgi:hypothetical protein
MMLVATMEYRADGWKEWSRIEKEAVRMYSQIKIAVPRERKRKTKNKKI